jgi:hypothetical protein
MTYTEIKTALRSFQEQGHAIPALNSKREVLETALEQLQAMSTAIEEPAAVGGVAIANPQSTVVEPAPITTTPTPKRIRPEHPAITELRELASLTEIALVWGIALVRSLIRFSTPRLVRAGGIAFRVVVVGWVLFRGLVVPKLTLAAYLVGIWGLTIGFKLIRRWRVAIV